MSELSPAQKALAAFNERHELCGPFDDDWVEQCLAAAIEELADQVVPEHKPWLRTGERGAAKHDVRLELFAIAAELRGDTTPTEDNGQA